VTSEIQEALNALNRQFGKDLYLAKFDSCCVAFNALKEVTALEERREALGRYFLEWIAGCAAAVNKWTPQYAALADAAAMIGEDKWEWVKKSVTCKLRRNCIGSEFPHKPRRGGPIEGWEPIEWWIRNACNKASVFGILRDEPGIPPQWLSPATPQCDLPTEGVKQYQELKQEQELDPIDFYHMRLRAELGREVEWALDLAKIEATTSNLRIS
jgi:hypothetical protein